MYEHQIDEDPEPSHPVPAGTLYVPVRPGPAGYCVRLFRTPLGGRTAVAFTTERQLAATLGTEQTWIRLSEPALRDLAAPLDVTAVTVDPQLAATAPEPAAERPLALPRPALAPRPGTVSGPAATPAAAAART
jgi:hypothetical protein